MAYEEALRCISMEAGSDLSARQYRFMTINSSKRLAVPSAGAAAQGVLQDKPDAAGRVGSLGIEGITKVEAGEAITAGDDISAGSNGLAVKAATGDVVLGKAMEGASGNGAIFAMLITNKAADTI